MSDDQLPPPQRSLPSNEVAFTIWAPPASEWSAWAKPILFAALDRARLPERSLGDWRGVDVSWAPAARRGTAIVVDLPNVRAVRTGMALASIG